MNLLQRNSRGTGITTNASWTQQHLDLLSNFDSVLLEVSIDAVDDVYDFVRYQKVVLCSVGFQARSLLFKCCEEVRGWK